MTGETSVAAFFDIDGTLLPPPSLEWRFIRYLIERDEITSAHLSRWLWQSAKTFPRDPHSAISGNKRFLAGIREWTAADWANSPRAQSVQFFQRGLERISWHAAQNHRVVLVSGTLAPLACAIAGRLPGVNDVLATELDSVAGLWAGRIVGEHVSGTEKARAAKVYAERHGFNLARSYAYGNDISDLPMLDSVAHPHAVNPTGRLRRLARSRRWPICDWKGVSASSLLDCSQRLFPKEAR